MELTTKQRNAFGPKVFGLPSKRAYPMPDASHAANAKARASEMFNKGKLSAAARAQIDAKANKVMAR